MLQMNRALAANDGSEAGVQRVQADFWKAEVERARQVLEKAELRAPIDGVVATPHVENFAGRKLQQGDSFAEIVDTSQAVVDVAIDDADAGLLKEGQKAVVKLNGYPDAHISWRSDDREPEGGDAAGLTGVLCAGGGGESGWRDSGGHGRTRESASGVVSLGYVFFRRPFLWLYSKAGTGLDGRNGAEGKYAKLHGGDRRGRGAAWRWLQRQQTAVTGVTNAAPPPPPVSAQASTRQNQWTRG